jgi:flagellar basal body-associated protein FliL
MTSPYEGTTYEGDHEPKRKINGWLIALIVVVVLIVMCCLCTLALILLAGPAVGTVFSTIVETLEVMTPMP